MVPKWDPFYGSCHKYLISAGCQGESKEQDRQFLPPESLYSSARQEKNNQNKKSTISNSFKFVMII